MSASQSSNNSSSGETDNGSGAPVVYNSDSLKTLNKCSAGTCSTSAPLTITQDGAIIKNVKIQNPTGDCVVVQAKNVQIVDSEIGPCGGFGILDYSDEFIARGNYIHETTKGAIHIYAAKNINIVNNRMENCSSAVRAIESTGVVVTHNFFRNMKGPVPDSNYVQYDKVYGANNKILCNYGLNEPGLNEGTDNISVYKSNGLPNDPILIKGNKVFGGTYPAGGGIAIADAGGSYITAENNVLVNPGQYGIAIMGGHHNRIINNKVYSEKTSISNVGVYVWDFYDLKDCSNNEVSGNRISWTSKAGANNPYWDSNSCGAVLNATPNPGDLTTDLVKEFLGSIDVCSQIKLR